MHEIGLMSGCSFICLQTLLFRSVLLYSLDDWTWADNDFMPVQCSQLDLSRCHVWWMDIYQPTILSLFTYVALEHKSSLKSLGYVCRNSQKYIEWVKMIDFSFMTTKLIRTVVLKLFQEEAPLRRVNSFVAPPKENSWRKHPQTYNFTYKF